MANPMQLDEKALDELLVSTASEVYDKSVGNNTETKEPTQENVEKTSEETKPEETSEEMKQEEKTSETEAKQEKTKEETKEEAKPEEEAKAQEAKAAEEGEKSLQQLLDELMKQDEKVEQKQEKVEEQVQKVEEAAKEEEQTKLMDELKKLKETIAEKDLEVDKYKKLAEMLKEEYDKVLKENVQLKYGGTDNSVLDIISSDDNLKNLVAYKAKYIEDPSDENKEKLLQVVKNMYQDLTGTSIEDLVSQRKQQEMNAFLPTEEANSVTAPKVGGGANEIDQLFV